MIEIPALSIITITRNNLIGLKRTADSIKNLLETGTVEWVVIDGLSSDGTREFLELQTRAKWTSESDSGIYDAMNKGLSRSSGEYVWFLNAGDSYNMQESPDFILDALQQNADIIWSDTELCDPNGKKLGLRSERTTRKLPSKLIPSAFLKGMVVSHQSFICRKSICTPYNLDLKHVSDYDWMIRTVRLSQSDLRLTNAISCFEIEGYSGQNRKGSLIERFRVMSAHFGIISAIISHIRILWVNLIRFIAVKK